MPPEVDEVRSTLQAFQEGYTARDLARLDDFMELFARSDEIELIGIGASRRGANEWFQGREAIRDIIAGDWTYWGEVVLDVGGAKITVSGETAWLSTSGVIVQTQTHNQALPIYLQQMKEILEDERMTPDEQLLEATHFGMRRLRERAKGSGQRWPFTFTAVLIRSEGGWRFHTIHWSMPVD